MGICLYYDLMKISNKIQKKLLNVLSRGYLSDLYPFIGSGIF